MEGICHLCSYWSCFEWTEGECKAKILGHLWLHHSPDPKPLSKNFLPPPGR